MGAGLLAILAGAATTVTLEPPLLKEAGLSIKMHGQAIEHVANGNNRLAAVCAGIAVISGIGALILGRERAGLETVLAQDELYMSQVRAAAKAQAPPASQ